MTVTVGEVATLAHGYTMADLHRLAQYEAHKWQGGDFSDRYDAAWHAAAVRLYAGDPPTKRDLHIAAREGIQAERVQALHYRGVNRDTLEPAPKFNRYWQHVATDSTDDFTERIAERIALAQVLSQLTDEQYEAISTLATMGSQKAAAEMLGLKPNTLQARISAARTIITDLWYAPEHARQMAPRVNPDSCRQGHARSEHGRKTNAGRWACRLCERDRMRRTRARLR